MNKCLLRCTELDKSFLFKGERTLILKGISFCLWEDELVSIVGASGCGKSTLLELLAGITCPDAGEIFFQDQSISGKSGLLGYMPQDDLLFPWLNVLDNVLLPVRISRQNIASAKARAMELAVVFGLDKHLEYHPWQLSGGLKQRAAFLRTCMTGSKVLLLDEPFANLDALTRMTFQDWLLEIKDKLKLTIILVTHDLDEAFKLSDRIFVMSSKPGRFDNVLDKTQDGYQEKAKQSSIKADILSLLPSG